MGGAVILLAAAMTAAPIPMKKPVVPVVTQAPVPIVGTWSMYWGWSDGVAWFTSDGSYQHQFRGALYIGTWQLKGRTLHVREGAIGANGALPDRWVDWSVELADQPGGGLKGIATGGYGSNIAVSLKPSLGPGA
jgi:hypothetical protein